MLTRLRAALGDLPQDRPFFLFAHFADPHEPYESHGSPERYADLVLDGAVLERVTTSDSTTWSRSIELAPGTTVFELKSDQPLSLKLLQCWAGKQPIEPRFLEGPPARRRRASCAPRSTIPPMPRCAPSSRWWVADEVPRDEVVGRYAREVEFADRHVGLLLQELKDRGLYDDALIVFTSDHGEALGEGGAYGHAYSLADHLIHVPLVVKPPRESPALAKLRARGGELVSLVDVVPTVLDLLALPPLSGPARALAALRRGPAADLVRDAPSRGESRPVRAARRALEARLRRRRGPLPALRTSESDPSERQDVFAREGERFGEWQAELRAAADGSRASELDMTTIDSAMLEQMRAIGYFGR